MEPKRTIRQLMMLNTDGITDSEIAAHVGVTRKAVTGWWKGVNPTPRNRVFLAQFCEMKSREKRAKVEAEQKAIEDAVAAAALKIRQAKQAIESAWLKTDFDGVLLNEWCLILLRYRPDLHAPHWFGEWVKGYCCDWYDKIVHPDKMKPNSEWTADLEDYADQWGADSEPVDTEKYPIEGEHGWYRLLPTNFPSQESLLRHAEAAKGR